MKRMIGITLAAMMAGCAMTPQEIRDQSDRIDVHLKLPPREAADCVTRNAQAIHEDMYGVILPLDKEPGFEVTLRIPILAAIIHLRPDVTGTNAQTWWRYSFLYERWHQKTFDGC